MKEEWKQVPDYERYLVSNTGRVITTVRGKARELKPQTDALGYHHYRLYPEDERFGSYGPGRGKRSKLYKAHRLVLETFNPTADTTLQVNHISGDKTDNRLDNLEWVTHSYNIQHSWDIGLRDLHGEKGALKRMKPIVAIHKDGHKRYFQSRMHLYFIIKCSRAAISNFLRKDDFIKRGPGKGYTFQSIPKLPEGEKFEPVENYKNRINVYNERFYYRKKRKKKLDS